MTTSLAAVTTSLAALVTTSLGDLGAVRVTRRGAAMTISAAVPMTKPPDEPVPNALI